MQTVPPNEELVLLKREVDRLFDWLVFVRIVVVGLRKYGTLVFLS